MNNESLPKEKIKNGIRYILDEETQTYLPDFEEDEEEVTVGKFGQMREQFLKEHYGATYSMMLLQNTLTDHLLETDEKAWKMLDEIIEAMAEQDGTDENLKISNPVKWVGLMNNYRAAAEERILKELIHAQP